MQKKNRKQYSAEFKAKGVKEMLREEKTGGQLAAEYGVHSNMQYRWHDQALAGLPSLFSDQTAHELAQKEAAWQEERDALYAEIGRLTMQLMWVKKNLVDCVSRTEQQHLIDWEQRELPISTQAQLLVLNRTVLPASAALDARSGAQASHRRDLHGPSLLWVSAHRRTTAPGRLRGR